jgi:hypothetical protein
MTAANASAAANATLSSMSSACSSSSLSMRRGSRTAMGPNRC